MKEIRDPRIMMTRIFKTENTEDSGLKEIGDYIVHVMEDNLEKKVDDSWVKKFRTVEISFINFGGELDESRFYNDNIFLNVSKEFIPMLQEFCENELSQYDIQFKEIRDIEKGELFIRFIKTIK